MGIDAAIGLLAGPPMEFDGADSGSTRVDL